MNFSDYVYFNFFSVGSIILVAFTFTLALFFLSIRKKSKATFHLGMAFACLVIFDLAYFVCYSFYNPLASFHRWFTVPFVMLGAAHIITFLINFPDKQNPRLAKYILIFQYIISISATLFFYKMTINANKIFNFEGHNFDFDSETVSKIIGLIILAQITLYFFILVWRVIQIKDKGRWWILTIGITYLFATATPSVLNTMSRDGLFGRDIYQISLDFLHIFGFFIMAVVYINATKDRTSFIGKIIGISVVTFMLVLQGLSYYTLQDREVSYNVIQRSEFERSLGNKYKSPDIKYIKSYSIMKDEFNSIYSDGETAVDLNKSKNEYMNTALYEKIKALPDDNFKTELNKVVSQGNENFTAYKIAILNYAESIKDNEKKKGVKIVNFIDSLHRFIKYQQIKIRQLPDGDFKNSIQKLLAKSDPRLISFRDTILSYVNKSNLEGKEQKIAVLHLLDQMNPVEKRNYRESENGRTHYVTFLKYDSNENKIYEAGFSYIAYREYIHPSAKQMIIMMWVVLVFVIAGFPLFFLGTLIRPLNSLQEGVSKVMDGDFSVDLKIKVQDEIGYITHSFNKMTSTLKTNKKLIDDYTENLEEKVKARTNELQAAMEEMEAMNDQLVEARDALWGEMELAKKIQTKLLPVDPAIADYDISAHMEPADEVGGDYYDIINAAGIDWIVIGDVSGHGVPAGLVMMMTQTAIHVVLAQNPGIAPDRLLDIVNATISDNIKRLGEDKYMTISVLAATLGGKFIFSGLHQDIMIFRAATGKVDLIETRGMWIGIVDDIKGMLDLDTLTMAPGDTMLLYSDGVTEAAK